jgi:hypothetical protein
VKQKRVAIKGLLKICKLMGKPLNNICPKNCVCLTGYKFNQCSATLNFPFKNWSEAGLSAGYVCLNFKLKVPVTTLPALSYAVILTVFA